MPRIVTRNRREEAVAFALAGAGLARAVGGLIVEGTTEAGSDIKDRLEHRRHAHAGAVGHSAVAQPGEAPHLRLVEPPIEESPVSSIERPDRSPVAA